MGSTFGTKKENNDNLIPHQERVNIQMFKAMEQLGRKLERVEEERDTLARRLALIESAATIDEKTGKFYLPVAQDTRPPQVIERPASKWPITLALVNSAIALFTLGVVATQPAQQLTPRQLAALNSLAGPRFATQFEDRAWKSIGEVAEEAPAAKTETPPQETPVVAEQAAPALPPAAAQPEAPKAPVVAETAPPPAPEAPPVAVAEKPAEAEPVKEAEPVRLVEKEPKPAPQPQKTAKAEPQHPPLEGRIAPDPGLPARLADLEKRAFENVPEAQHDLATIYASGKLVAQDYKRAVYWFSKAANGGIANAHYNLGVMFQQGLGVRQDVGKALGWYQKAAQLGHPEAMYNLGIAYIEGVGAQRDIPRGVAYFKSAANAGVAQAAYNLGVLYESSFIGSIDLDKAIEWYQVAANEGHADGEAAALRLKTQLARAEDAPPATATADGLTVADLVEPAAGEETGEGDSSPPDEGALSLPPPVTRNAIVMKVQEALIRRGLLPGRATGILDQRTSDAIRAWQAKAGLAADGKASQELLDKLAPAQ